MPVVLPLVPAAIGQHADAHGVVLAVLRGGRQRAQKRRTEAQAGETEKPACQAAQLPPACSPSACVPSVPASETVPSSPASSSDATGVAVVNTPLTHSPEASSPVA